MLVIPEIPEDVNKTPARWRYYRHAIHVGTPKLFGRALLGGSWVAQPKIDGVWAYVVIGMGADCALDSCPKVYGRRGIEIGSIECEPTAFAVTSVLVGEWKDDHFHAFDCIMANDREAVDRPFGERAELAQRVIDQYRSDDISWVHYRPLKEAADLFALACGDFADHWDGVVLKDCTAAYNELDRPHWKVKPSITVDFICTGINISGSQYQRGTACSIVGGLFVDGELRDVSKVSGLPHDLRAALTADPASFIGRVFEVRGQKQYKTGAVRHPVWVRWRDDKPSEDCLLVSPPSAS